MSSLTNTPDLQNTESTLFWRIVHCSWIFVSQVILETRNNKHLHYLQRVCDKRVTFIGRIVNFERYAN